MNKEALAKSQLISVGFRSALRNAKKGTTVVASNCPAEHVDALKKAGATVEAFDGTARDLGIVYGKPFNISVLLIDEKKTAKK